MCGLVGVVALDGAGIDPTLLVRMSSTIRHRGPDDEGIYTSGSVGFGFRRLSILDLSPSGHQPMVSPDGEAVIVFNGEIYNYVELRKELQTLGHTFRSSGDTEVLLHSYLQWGVDCLTRLNGMWAFLIFDKRRRVVFGSRDRFGKKPLYCYRDDRSVFIASEIKAILASGSYKGGSNWNVVSQFFLYDSFDHVDTRNKTFFADINEIPAGSAFELDQRGMWREWRYWSLAEVPQTSVQNPAESFAEVFEDAVRLRLRSDVPVGIFLSGGLDSTSIACAVARIRQRSQSSSIAPFLAFSYQAQEYDESVYLTETVKQVGAELIPFRPDPHQLWDRLEQLVWYQDEPVHSLVAMITFELSRLASSRGVKVILNGSGPDESIAGYHSYFRYYWYTLVHERGWAEAWREVHRYYRAHGEKALTFFPRVMLDQLKSGIAQVGLGRRLARWKRSRDLRGHPWFTPELIARLPDDCLTETQPFLDFNLRHSVERAPLPLYLRIEDRNSMAHSIEARMPFLDPRLMSLSFQLPANWKMRGPWNKYVLREAMRQKIPESVRNRLDKMGFPVPMKKWFADAFNEPLNDVLSSQQLRERGIYNMDAIRRDLKLHREGRADVSSKLFNLVQFELWSKLEKDHRRAASIAKDNRRIS